MIKRIIALFLVCIFSIPILSVPVSASDLPYVELLDMGYWILDGSESSSFTLVGGSIGRFDFDQTMKKVQIVYNGSAELYVNGQVYTGTSLGGSLYRVEQEGLFNELVLQCASGKIDLYSVRAIPSDIAYVPIKFSAAYNGPAGSETASGVYQFDAMIIPDVSFTGGAFSLSVYPADFSGLEYIDIYLTFIRWEVASLAVTQGDHAIDYDILSLNNHGDLSNDFILRINVNEGIIDGEPITLNMQGGSGTLFGVNVHAIYGLPPVAQPDGVVGIIVRVLDAIKTNFVTLINNLGQWFNSVTTSLFNNFESLKEYLYTQFDRLMYGVSGQQTSADEFNDNVSTQETQFDEYEDVLSTSPTFSEDDVGSLIYAVANQNREPDFFALWSRILMFETVSYPVLFSIAFALIGYLLFGRRF